MTITNDSFMGQHGPGGGTSRNIVNVSWPNVRAPKIHTPLLVRMSAEQPPIDLSLIHGIVAMAVPCATQYSHNTCGLLGQAQWLG